MRIGASLALVGVFLGGLLYFFAVQVPEPREYTIATSTGAYTATSTAPEAPTVVLKTRPTAMLGGQTVQLDIADTPEKRQKGLSGRSGLAEDEGMLFIFPENGLHSFWMKDMLFSIDILWLNSEGEVVHLVENASPSSYPASFSPENPALFVLELSAGASARLGVEVGDTVTLLR